MKVIEELFDLDLSFSLSSLGVQRENAVFFDIETTGLSARSSHLYLIGVVFYDEILAAWKLIQYFADTVADEIPILRLFFRLLSKKKQLISFNGEGFDIPYLKAMCSQYEIPHSFDSVESLDIFKLLREGKKLLRLPSYRLKACEEFLGIYREDKFNGGELIQVYQDYQKDADTEKLRLLLLHNAEDLKNLPYILPILSYSYILSGRLQLKKADIVPLPTGDASCLDLTYESDVYLPRPIDLDLGTMKKSPFAPERIFLSLSENQLNLSARMLQGELKYFYSDYKNYYYLPAEDMAIHKSVAEFVDSRAKVKASSKTAYQRKNGIFLPELSPIFTPVFLREYKDKLLFTEWEPEKWQPEKPEVQENAGNYLRDFLRILS